MNIACTLLSRWRRFDVAILLALGSALAGCTASGINVKKHLMGDKHAAAVHKLDVDEQYILSCPDVVAIQVAERAELSCQGPVGPDGRLQLPLLENPRVEGHSVAETRKLIAELAGVPAPLVSVRVHEYRSQVVYLFGQVAGKPRTLPYRGQETVIELLQRAGGIREGAEPDDVHVIRPRIAEGHRPEVFRVDLRAIVLKNDDSTNLRLQPFDQVHIGETRQATIERCIPPWLRPTYQAIWDTTPADALPRQHIIRERLIIQKRERRVES